MKNLIRRVTLILTFAAILPLGAASAMAEDIRLENGRMIRIQNHRAMMRSESGKPVPVPPGVYKTTDGGMIKIGEGGSVEKVKKGKKKKKDKD
jgi:hypothetical protein